MTQQLSMTAIRHTCVSFLTRIGSDWQQWITQSVCTRKSHKLLTFSFSHTASGSCSNCLSFTGIWYAFHMFQWRFFLSHLSWQHLYSFCASISHALTTCVRLSTFIHRLPLLGLVNWLLYRNYHWGRGYRTRVWYLLS